MSVINWIFLGKFPLSGEMGNTNAQKAEESGISEVHKSILVPSINDLCKIIGNN